ncbi:MAG TPA: MFS transporter [Candidatus Binatia bacterium]|nr:MFS transporter [Candidatus Binatia bacterium]
MAESPVQRQSLAAFRYRDFTLYQSARLFTVLATEMQSVAVGWQVFEMTKRPLDLGYVGLAQFWPTIVLFLAAGHAADRFNRRNIVTLCYAGLGLASAILFFLTISGSRSVHAIYAALTLVGVVRAFNGAAGQSMVPQIVPEQYFPNAVAWAQTVFNTATIIGPALGGLIYAAFRGPTAVYASSMIAAAMSVVAASQIRLTTTQQQPEDVTLNTLLAGFHFIWRKKLILGLISLDLFAVLLGGAVALLPVYAREILRVGPWGLGLLRSAPAIGAVLMATLLAHRPLQRHAGMTMLWSVAGFGVFTIVFGLSRNLIVSIISLLLVGASDMISVIIRGTLVQLSTPDKMRGRVSAVNSLFIGTSNEFGQFESGLTAHWFGTVPAVVIGGVGTLLVIALWAWWFPELRGADRLVTGPEVAAGELP